MARGRKKNQELSGLPPKGYYRSPASMILACKRGGAPISDKAFRLWHVIAAYSWDGGGCDLTDETLAIMVGSTPRWVQTLRDELVEAGLLRETWTLGQRLLEPVYANPPNNESEENGRPDCEAVRQALLQRGAYPEPARAIASMMAEAGFSVEQAIEIFQAHMDDTGGNMAITVWRLKQGWFVPAQKEQPPALPDDPDLARLVQLLADRCGTSLNVAAVAVQGASAHGWTHIRIELEILRWLSYCLHSRFGRGTTPATFIPSRIRDGMAVPEWFREYPYNLQSDIHRLEVSLSPPAPAPARRQTGRKRSKKSIEETVNGAPVSDVWARVLSLLEFQMPRATFNAWVRPTTVLNYDIADDVFIVGVHNSYAKDWLEHRLRPLIERALVDVVGREVQVRFAVRRDAD